MLSIVVMWVFSKQLTEYSVTKTLLWIVLASSLLSLPNIGLVYGLHRWTEATLGFGAHGIALVNTATTSPFAEVGMIPLLALIAYYAPPGHRAAWFALMASLMNVALVASQLQTKYLNDMFVVSRGQYTELGPLLICAVALGFVIPVTAIALCRPARRPPRGREAPSRVTRFDLNFFPCVGAVRSSGKYCRKRQSSL